MTRKAKSKKRKRQADNPGWWSSMDPTRRRRTMVGCAVFALTIGLAFAAATGLDRLEAHVLGMVATQAAPSVVWIDLPEQLEPIARDDLQASVAELTQRVWTDETSCRAMANRLASVGWVVKVNYVRRTSNGQFQVSCRYRTPKALVQQDGAFVLVGQGAVRLPGKYGYDSAWPLIQGVRVPPPVESEPWPSDALRAGLAVLDKLETELFRTQITAVLVGNFGGRVDPRASHIELATDQAGGRVRWGSALGFELEENSVEQKLAILRENYRRSGRVDEHHQVIDISTFPDRYTIPG